MAMKTANLRITILKRRMTLPAQSTSLQSGIRQAMPSADNEIVEDCIGFIELTAFSGCMAGSLPLAWGLNSALPSIRKPFALD